jgi:hypothetical protein
MTEHTEHTLLTHVGCTVEGCAICAGSVKLCLVCNGAETEAGGNGLTSECCGKPLTEEQKAAVSTSDLDYKNFRWHDKRLGPTLEEVLKEKKLRLEVGAIACCLDHKEGEYICVGSYRNSMQQTLYSFHQVIKEKNRHNAGFVTLLHYARFVERFGEL